METQIKRTAIILAGGRSSRLGQDKAMMTIDGKPIIQNIRDTLTPHFSEILVSSDNTEGYAFLNLKVVPDREKERGPLMGIYSGLLASSNEINFVIACDIPAIDIAFMDELLGASDSADIVVPCTGPEKFEPLFGIYRKSIIPVIAKVLAEGHNKISRIFSRCRTSYIPFKDSHWYKNINTHKDFQAL
jgi:molybdopterin-guanine dinucleotide biosynthesis protein A